MKRHQQRCASRRHSCRCATSRRIIFSSKTLNHEDTSFSSEYSLPSPVESFDAVPLRSNGAHSFAPNTPDDVPANFDEVVRVIPADRHSRNAVRGNYKLSLIEPSRGKLARVDFIRNFLRASRVTATLFPSLVC